MTTFLPIVQRELSVAARRRSTFRIRWWCTLVALLVAFFMMGVLSMGRGRAGMGHALFSVLTTYAFGLCLLAGVGLTAGCLSEERREGTLGLLFLTDLNGLEVVLGKFVAGWLGSFYGLLAMLPVLALPLLLGGVTGAEFWRRALALVNTLFFSLAAGIFVSTFNRDSQRAASATLGLLLLLVVGLPVFEYVAQRSGAPTDGLGVSTLSPFSPFTYAAAALYARHWRAFWVGIAASEFLAWGFLAGACWALPRIWQECHWPFADRVRGWIGSRTRARPRRDLLSQNPVLWLVSTELGTPWVTWLLVLGCGVVTAVAVWLEAPVRGLSVSSWFLAYPLGLVIKLWFALQACRFFVSARRNGSLELLLCTPLSNRDIVRGHARALARSFLWPVIAFFLVVLVPGAVRMGLSLGSGDLDKMMEAFFSSFGGGWFCLRMALDLLAIGSFGMGLALTMKKPGLAPAVTILVVVLLPWFLCWLGIVADLIFIAWGSSKWQQDLRKLCGAR